MGKTCVVLFLAVLLVSSIRPAYACDCVRPGSACQEFGAAEAVFVGRVVAADERRVEFAVLEALGGISHSTVVLQQPGSDCDFRFEVRQEYLVYAKEGKDAGRLTASICSRTALLVQSRSDLAYLRTLSTLPPDTRARITGSVVRWKDGSSIRRSGSVPIPSTSVFLSDGAQSFKGATDKNGRFHIPNVPFGRYEIRVEPPAGLYFTGHPPLNIFDPRECEPLNLSVRYDGRIFGRVLDANGRNVGGVALALIDSASRAHPNPEPALFARTLLDGQFEFRRVQPGSYVLSVDTAPDVEGGRRFYRGTSVVTPNHREALKVSVGPGRQVQLNDVTLPKSMLLVTMKGVVLDDQKRPAAGAEVHLLTDHGRIPLRPFQRTGADGAFAFAVVEGHAYKVLVNYDTRDARGWTLETFWGEVTFNGTSASPLVIQLRRSGR